MANIRLTIVASLGLFCLSCSARYGSGVSEARADTPSRFSEAEAHAIVNAIAQAYEGIVPDDGTLSFQVFWNSGRNSDQSNANRSANGWLVTLEAHDQLGPDSLMLLTCHELGHVFGGFPYYAPNLVIDNGPSSAEGQADYYATHFCARRLWEAGVIHALGNASPRRACRGWRQYS